MKVETLTMPEDGNVSSIVVGRAIVRFGSNACWRERTPAAKPIVVPGDVVPGPFPHQPGLGDDPVCGGFVGERLYALALGITQPGYPAVPPTLRVYEEAKEVTRHEVPGATWAHVDGGGRLILHFADRSQVYGADGTPGDLLGPPYAGPSPSGRWIARTEGGTTVVTGEGTERRIDGRRYTWIDGDQIVVSGEEVVRVDLRTGDATTLPRWRDPTDLAADPTAVWLIREGGLEGTKFTRVYRVPLDGGAPAEVELARAKSHSYGCAADGKLYVAVNWAKAVYVITP